MAGSTGESDALEAVNRNIDAQRFGMEQQLFGQAGDYATLASQDYNAVIGAQQQMDTNYQNALGKFVGSLTGATGGQATPA